MKLQDKVAIVTGASSGIGRAVALRFGQEGAHVCVNGLAHMDEAEAVAAEIRRVGRRAIAVKADVSRPADIDTMVAAAIREFGRVDILVNNAGVMHIRSVLETTEEIWDRTLDINLKGHFFCAQKVIPHMIAQGKGRIINLGSIFGETGVPNACVYGVTKIGIHGMTKMMAIELAPHRITVNAVAPGNVVTPLNDPLYALVGGQDVLARSYPIGRVGRVEDVAPAAVYFASDEADFVTGAVLFVDGGYAAQ
ncbi:MAG TPA: 3-oxoacyl-ACP reductase family protein [Candidatus Methylomirabilis sp.]|jgi:NAD(P)-dependent dehydrogenase (short-subunit alcohol dehydrogenase family)